MVDFDNRCRDKELGRLYWLSRLYAVEAMNRRSRLVDLIDLFLEAGLLRDNHN